MIYKISKSVLVVLLLLNLCGLKKSGAQVKTAAPPSQFRVVGYMVATDIEAGNAAGFDFSKLTYLDIAFINPDKNGNFSSQAGLSNVISAAHSNKVNVLASIGGGLAPAYYASLLSDSMRANFIQILVGLTLNYQFDGIDVDLEGSFIDNNYESFVTSLSTALKQKGKIITAAIATAYSTQYTANALAQFDFVNIMSYDKTGPWGPSNPGQHSPYSMAVADLVYWGGTRGISKAKLSLGVPFYGYGFGTNAPQDMSYKDIVNQYPGAENADSANVAGGGIIYYNGIATIKAKSMLALQKAGGIMIWQLLQDAGGNYSLLNTINATLSAAEK